MTTVNKQLLRKTAGLGIFILIVSGLALFGSTVSRDVGQKDESEPKKYRVAVIDEKDAVPVGGKYEAEIMLVKQKFAQKPIITVAGKRVKVEGGKGKFTVTSDTPGKISYPVYFKMNAPESDKKRIFKDSIAFTAYDSHPVISADKLNVFYTCLENPVTISVPGYPRSRLKAEITKGELRKTVPGNYVAKVPCDARKTRINVYAVTNGGILNFIGSGKFRIVQYPYPTPLFGGKASGRISPEHVKIVKAVVAGRGYDFVGPPPCRHVVSHFRLTYIPENGKIEEAETNGTRLTEVMKTMLKAVKTGDKFVIDQIKIKGPCGVRLHSKAMTFTVE